MVVTVAAVRQLGKVDTLLPALGMCLTNSEVLGDAQRHQFLGAIQGESYTPMVRLNRCRRMEGKER